MSHSLISRNADLAALVKDGYTISIIGGYLVVRGIPYVTEHGAVDTADIVSTLELSDEPLTQHTVWWTGQMPHYADRSSMQASLCCSVWPTGFPLGDGLTAFSRWSMKLRGHGTHRPYADHKEKIDTYVTEVSGQADALFPGSLAIAKDQSLAELELQSRFKYLDMNAFRSGTRGIEQTISEDIVAVIGVGGSGSYLVDILAKTNVKELHLYDDDVLSYHNAFRLPGAAEASELTGQVKKVHWLSKQYSPVREDGIYAHPIEITSDTWPELGRCTMVFIAVDHLPVRRAIQAQCSALGIAHIAVGLGVEVEGEANDQLGGMVKVEICHVPRVLSDADRQRYMAQADADDMYGNIQTAELNMLSAALAVVEWKAMRGFYVNDRAADIDSQVYVVPTGRINTKRKGDL